AEDAGGPDTWGLDGPSGTGGVTGRQKLLGTNTQTSRGWADPTSSFSMKSSSNTACWPDAQGKFTQAINCTNNNAIYAFHPGGANILFGDGSVRFLRETTSIFIVSAITTAANGEVITTNY